MTGIDEAAPVPTLLQRYGRSRATEAGIWLADRPAPLYQLLVLATLVQVVWPDAAPYCDHRVLGSAARSGCPVTAGNWPGWPGRRRNSPGCPPR
jgi:hypothetical protein